MDTIIFLLILAMFVAMRSRKRWLFVALFFLSLAATMLLFWSHVTQSLDLSF